MMRIHSEHRVVDDILDTSSTLMNNRPFESKLNAVWSIFQRIHHDPQKGYKYCSLFVILNTQLTFTCRYKFPIRLELINCLNCLRPRNLADMEKEGTHNPGLSEDADSILKAIMVEGQKLAQKDSSARTNLIAQARSLIAALETPMEYLLQITWANVSLKMFL